jgi:hypothetical protein
MSEKQYALIVVILYSLLILFSLGDPAMTLTMGRLFLGERLDLFLSLVPYGIISLLLVHLTFIAKETQGRKFLFLITISVVLFFIVRYLNGWREKAHLIEFSLLGGLILWSATRWGLRRLPAYLLVLAAGLLTIGLNELLQTSLSVKVFSVRDVLVNTMAVALGAITYGGLFWERPPDRQESEVSP